jgi:hypothetical protein
MELWGKGGVRVCWGGTCHGVDCSTGSYHTLQTVSSLLYNEYRVSPGVKRPGRGAEHPPASSAEVGNE